MTHPDGPAEADIAPFLWIDADPAVPAPVADPRGERGAPGETGLWVFVFGDLTIFSIFFVVLLVEHRSEHARTVAAARDLVLPLGFTNTLILLTSSWAVALATASARAGDRRRCRSALRMATVLAAGFVGVKTVEYTVELAGHGLSPAEPFAAVYLVLTGLHLVHVVVGAVLLGRWRHLVGHADPDTRASRFGDVVAVYWHMVDLLWVLIFTLAYLVARS